MSAQQLDNNDIVMGQMVRIANQEKKFNENQNYVAIQIEDEDGNNERCILFTEIEMSDMEKIKFDFALNAMKAGRLYNAIIDGKETNLLKIMNGFGELKLIRLSPSQLKIAEERAQRNPEDLTKKSMLTDLMD